MVPHAQGDPTSSGRIWKARRGVALTLVASGLGCSLPATPLPPTLGYGEPYRGAGAPIYVKDSRTDWDISEGPRKITSEMALEASGDPEYETRRQIAKRHNARLHAQGKARRKRGMFYVRAGLGMLVAGLVVSIVAPRMLAGEDVVAPTAAMPEMRTITASGASFGAALGGVALIGLGSWGVLGGLVGGRRPPPYHTWRTPPPLHRPAYVRQHTEQYNEKIGAPAVEEQPGGVDTAIAPGQRRMPPMRGGAR